MCAVPAEVHTALSNADAASADLMFMIAAVRSSLQTAAEQSNNDAEGAERSAAQMTARMPATARHSREDAVKWRPESDNNENGPCETVAFLCLVLTW